MARGAPAPIASGVDQRSKVDGGLGDANFQPRAIGFGKVEHGKDVGMHDAEYRSFGTKGTQNIYEVSHGLGRKPGFAIKVKSVNTQTPVSHYSVEPWNYEKWTENTVTVHVWSITGSLDGGQITLMIGGEQ